MGSLNISLSLERFHLFGVIRAQQVFPYYRQLDWAVIKIDQRVALHKGRVTLLTKKAHDPISVPAIFFEKPRVIWSARSEKEETGKTHRWLLKDHLAGYKVNL